MKMVRKYKNGYEREFTIISAVYGNPDNTSAIVFTEESGAIVVAQNHESNLWEQLMNSGVNISQYELNVQGN